MDNFPPFSVAMSVYRNDDPEQLSIALDSICRQSCPPTEIYLVIDGPIGLELDRIISEFSNRYGNFTIERLETNAGLGNALRHAVENCKYELVARMDSDDISAPDRFKKQLTEFSKTTADVIGGWTLGFIGDIYTGRVSPSKPAPNHDQIAARIGEHTPASHVTVMFKRSSVLKAGNYIDLYYHEDYYLWARMIKLGYTFRNIPDYLVYVRKGRNQAARHGGWRYFKAELFLRKYMLHSELITRAVFAKSILLRFIYQILLPPKIRSFIDMKFRRNEMDRSEVEAIISNSIKSDCKTKYDTHKE